MAYKWHPIFYCYKQQYYCRLLFSTLLLLTHKPKLALPVAKSFLSLFILSLNVFENMANLGFL